MNKISLWIQRASSHWLWIAFALIVLVMVIPYSPVLEKSFVQEEFVQVGIRYFDAQVAAAQDTWSAWLPLLIKWGINAPVTQRPVIRSVRDWFFWSDFFISGLNPLGYQLTNLVLHAFTSFAVALLMWQLVRRRAEAILAGVLFAVMSIHAEAVADLPSRGHVLVTLLMTLSVFFYALLPTRRSLILAGVMFILALGSVETALTLPLILILYELIYRRDAKWRAVVARQLPFWILLAGYVGLRFVLFGGNGGAPAVTDSASLSFFVAGYTMYASDPFIVDISTMQVALVLALAVLLWVIYRARREVVFGLLWIPIPLLVAITFPPQERYFYAPSVGLALVLASVLANPLPRLTRVGRALGWSAAVVLLSAYSVGLYNLSVNWQNASKTANRILTQLQTLQPHLPEGANLYFVGLPTQIRRAPVFNNPLDVQYAVELAYNDSSLQTFLTDEFPLYPDDPEHTYFFEYQGRNIVERGDLEAQLRGRPACPNANGEFDWVFTGDAGGWTPWNDIVNASVVQNTFEMQSEDDDPYIGSPLLDIDPAQLAHIEITMRVRASQPKLQGAVYWQTQSMDDFSPDLFETFDVIADNQMRTYQVNLNVVGTDHIVRLRLDPTDAPADIAIQSIKIICG